MVRLVHLVVEAAVVAVALGEVHHPLAAAVEGGVEHPQVPFASAGDVDLADPVLPCLAAGCGDLFKVECRYLRFEVGCGLVPVYQGNAVAHGHLALSGAESHEDGSPLTGDELLDFGVERRHDIHGEIPHLLDAGDGVGVNLGIRAITAHKAEPEPFALVSAEIDLRDSALGGGGILDMAAVEVGRIPVRAGILVVIGLADPPEGGGVVAGHGKESEHGTVPVGDHGEGVGRNLVVKEVSPVGSPANEFVGDLDRSSGGLEQESDAANGWIHIIKGGLLRGRRAGNCREDRN